ncbi:hypothetical protein HYT02_02040 [Candidatus Gottesmanbacteria bacterium]|nr:hypothetical protein [Candidatus Gottesmanbacteria bacterium]
MSSLPESQYKQFRLPDNTPPQEVRDESSYFRLIGYDTDVLEKEKEVFLARFEEINGNLRSQLLGPPGFISQKDLTNLRRYENESTEITNAERHLSLRRKQGDRSISDFTLLCIHVGGNILRSRANNKLENIVREYNVNPQLLDQFVKCTNVVVLPFVTTKLKGMSLEDFLTKTGEYTPTQILDFLMLPQRYLYRYLYSDQNPEAFSDLLEGNDPEFVREYPVYSIVNTYWALRGIYALMSNQFNIASNNEHIKQIVFAIQEIIKKTNHIQERLVSYLLNPTEDKDNIDLRNRSKEYLESDSDFAEFLWIISVAENDKMSGIYRRVVDLSKGAVDVDFYRLLGDRIVQFLENPPQNIILDDDIGLTIGQLLDLTSDDYTPDLSKPKSSIHSVSRAFSDIFKKSLAEKYQFDPSELGNKQGLFDPHAITVDFKDRLKKRFTITLHWYNEDTGESSNMYIFFDLNNKSIDWSILDSLDFPENSHFKQWFIDYSSEILNHILTNKISLKTAQDRDPVYKMRKDARKITRDLNGISYGLNLQPEEQKLRREIVGFVDDSVISALNKLNPQDREAIERAIKKLNDSGLGAIEKISPPAKDGVERYRLKSNTPSGPFRILLIQTESTSGVERFLIEDIGRRKDIYRRKGYRF